MQRFCTRHKDTNPPPSEVRGRIAHQCLQVDPDLDHHCLCNRSAQDEIE